MTLKLYYSLELWLSFIFMDSCVYAAGTHAHTETTREARRDRHETAGRIREEPRVLH